MHCIRAEVNAAGPFHAAEIGIDGDGVEDTGVQQLEEHATAPCRFNGENPTHTVVEGDFQPALRKRFGRDNPSHALVTIAGWLVSVARQEWRMASRQAATNQSLRKSRSYSSCGPIQNQR
jgi:hypothetical protein